jgi:hypothetical protein
MLLTQMKRTYEEALFQSIFPKRSSEYMKALTEKYDIYDFDKIKFLDQDILKKDINTEKWKSLSDHQKKYYIDKGYLNLANEIEDLFETQEDFDIREAESKAHFAFTNIPTTDMDPERTRYTKLGKSIAYQMLKNAHLRFGLPNRDHLVGAIAMSYPYEDYFLYERDFPPEDLGPGEEYVDTYPPLNNEADYPYEKF